MRISLVGGMDRLHRHYQHEAESLGIELRIFNKSMVNLPAKLEHSAAVVLFTSKISHSARKQVMGVAQSRKIPVFQSHQCGVCALRDCLNCVKAGRSADDGARSTRPLAVGAL